MASQLRRVQPRESERNFTPQTPVLTNPTSLRPERMAQPTLDLSSPAPDPTAGAVHPPLRRDYQTDFALTADYQTSLPDLMAGDGLTTTTTAGPDASVTPLAQVGISGFRLPLRFAARDGGDPVTLETRVVGTVGLAAGTRAINMSRIIRTFYEFQDRTFTVDLLPEILARMCATVGCASARLRLEFSFPLLQPSLRSGVAGYQFYDAAFEAELPADGGPARRQVRLDFVYSSACPCSTELSEHARGGAAGVRHPAFATQPGAGVGDGRAGGDAGGGGLAGGVSAGVANGDAGDRAADG